MILRALPDPEIQAFGKTKGERNSNLTEVTNSKEKALSCELMPSNQADVSAALRVFGDVTGQVILGDKGYDSDTLRETIFDSGGGLNIPGRKNRKQTP